MTPTEFILKLKKQTESLNKQLYAEITANGRAADMMTLRIVERVRDKGKSFDGSSFKPYSTKPMLTGVKNFLNKSGADAFFKSKSTKWVTKNGHHLAIVIGGYAEFRRMNGRKSEHKNFEWTAKMWQDFGIKEKTVDADGILIKQKGSTEQKKLNWNSEREEKSIIQPNAAELKLFANDVNNELIKLITIK